MSGPVQPGAFLSRVFGLEDRVAVVVGGAGRIGRVLCQALAGAGAKVAVVDLDEASARKVAEQVQGETGRAAGAFTVDATDPDSLTNVADEVAGRLGPATILVNSTQFRGTGFYSSDPFAYPKEAWQKVIDVNLTGTFLACQAFARLMAEQGGGSIINLASTYGVVSADPRIYGESGVNSPVSYAASKAAVINLTRYLAVHWREQKIRVNCLVPGGVFDNQQADFVKAYTDRTPLGRMAKADDYQGAVLFMASEASSYMTGSVLTVDGGWTAW